MPRGAALSEGSSGEYISHFASLRMRVTGFGNLKMSIFSLDDIKWKDMVPFVLAYFGRVIPTRIINFKSQRAAIEIGTTELGEWFKINRIVIYTKATDTSYPGN